MFAFLLSFMVVAFANPECAVYGPQGVHPSADHSVTNYKSEFKSCDLSQKTVFSLRSFQLNGELTNLVVFPNSLKTQIIKNSCLKACQAISAQDYEQTTYGRVLDSSIQAPYPLQNDGLITGRSNKNIMALTIDMCPSKKGISKNVYDKLTQISKQNGAAFPVGIAITKMWLQSYPQHFSWLKKLQQTGQLKILWINHSATHPYKAGVSLENNFLLGSGVKFTSEVLGTEIALIQAGVTPSVFFRFPGLVSSQKLIESLGNWGLIPLGSKAWLAKGEKPKADSIILIHGNKNEPAGEVAFLNYVETKSSDIAWASVLDLLSLPN